MRKLFVVFALVFALCASASANLVINGDFEAGSVAWQMTGASVIDQNTWSIPTSPNAGKFAATVNSWGGNWNGPSGTFTQEVYGMADGAYILTFEAYVGARHSDTSRPAGLKAIVNGETVWEKLQPSLQVYTGDFFWETINVPVTLAGGYASVTFEHYARFAEWTWIGTDGVSLTQVVPEPSSIVALASGLFGMLGFGIRRRK